MIYNAILILTIVFVCDKHAHCQNVTFNVVTNCVSHNLTLTMNAFYSGEGTVTGVEWYYSGRSAVNLVILASTCAVFGGIDPGYPPASRMKYQCPSTGLANNTFKLLVLNATDAERKATWGATFRLAIGSSPSPFTGLVTAMCDCVCTSDGLANQITCSIAVASTPLVIIAAIVLILVGRIGTVVAWKLTRFDIGGIVFGASFGVYAAIVGTVAVCKNGDCRNCPTCDFSRCDVNNRLGITSIVLGICGICVTIGLIVNRRGWCGKHLTCLNTVLPVCKDTEARGPPDGKSDNPAAKEKHREVKLLTHKEQTQQHHKETAVNKGKPSGEKHEELSKGQPRPLPVPTGNNRPMPEIPSDRHKRGLSANFNDDHDKPLDDNIVHTLPVVKKPKTALDPMNAEDQSKNSDDQPKKKKKRKKDRDTSRSEEMEDGY